MEPTSKSKAFGRRLYRARMAIEPELGQEEIARALGVSQSAVSFWESGLRAPSPARLRQLAKLLGDLSLLQLAVPTPRRKSKSSRTRRARTS